MEQKGCEPNRKVRQMTNESQIKLTLDGADLHTNTRIRNERCYDRNCYVTKLFLQNGLLSNRRDYFWKSNFRLKCYLKMQFDTVHLEEIL